jgi:hypothetical protein
LVFWCAGWGCLDEAGVSVGGASAGRAGGYPLEGCPPAVVVVRGALAAEGPQIGGVVVVGVADVVYLEP